MQTTKKSFQLYFDNVPLLMTLPDEQLGRMMKRLFCYAADVAQDPELTTEAARAEVEADPVLSDGARMAFHFVAATVYRDTQKWWQTTRARLRRTEERMAQDAAQKERSFSAG